VIPFGIAVLPVASLSERPADRELAAGLTEQLTHVLSQNRYPVVARTTAAQWRDRGADVRVLGRELGVSHVLEGSVRRGGDRVRVTMQLVATDTGMHVWTETFDTGEGDSLATQDRVTSRVAAQVYKFVWEDAVALKRDPRLAELSELVVEDRRSFSEGRWEDNLAIVERLLTLAPEREPFIGWRGYAHASISLALANLHMFSERSFAEAGPELLFHAERAAALVPNKPFYRMVLARAYAQHWRWADAEREMARACELAPRGWTCGSTRAYLCAAFGCVEEQIESARRMCDALPAEGNSWAILANALFVAGQLEEAEAASARAQEYGGAPLGALLPHIRWQRGQRAEAVRSLREGLAARGFSEAAREVERRGASAPEEAWRWFAEWLAAGDSARGRLPRHFSSGMQFAELDDLEAALAALERSVAAHEAGFDQFGLSPAFDPIRDTPRFRALIEKVGLAPYQAKYLQRPAPAPAR
jgi:TolB-like protein